MKTIIFLIMFLSSCLYSQDYSKAIKEQAEITAKALVSNDLEVMIKHTYPKLVTNMGGKEKFFSLIKQGKAQMAMQGIELEKVTVGTPGKTVIAGDEIHALVPQNVIMKLPAGKMLVEGYMIAISKDKGKHWFFLDTSTLDMEKVKMVLPNYNMELVIPEKKQPTFMAN